MSAAQRKKGIITASTGNHGIGVALGAKIFNANATIYLCDSVPKTKVQNISDYGAKIEYVKGMHLQA